MRRAILIAAVVAASNIVILLPLPATADPILIRGGGVGFETGDPAFLTLEWRRVLIDQLVPAYRVLYRVRPRRMRRWYVRQP